MSVTSDETVERTPVRIPAAEEIDRAPAWRSTTSTPRSSGW